MSIWSSFGRRWVALPDAATARLAIDAQQQTTVLDNTTASFTTADETKLDNARETLTANRTYYVRTDGSDSNTGLVDSAGGAFLTLQKAADVVFGTLDLKGFSVSISVGDGTYTAGVSQTSPQTGAGSITFRGNTTTPTNCLISVTSSNCFEASNLASFAIDGFELRTTTSGNCVNSSVGAHITIGSNVNFGACATRHVVANRAGAVSISTGYAISGGASSHLWAEQTGVIFSNGDTFVLSNTPAFSSAFCSAVTGGNIRATGATFSGTGATGTRYAASGNAVINTNGGGASYFPGSGAGTTATGGQYL